MSPNPAKEDEEEEGNSRHGGNSAPIERESKIDDCQSENLLDFAPPYCDARIRELLELLAF